MATPLGALAQYIATDLGVGTYGTDVFDTSMPDKTDGSYDTAVCVVSTPGQAPDLAIQGNTDYPGFLVLSRSGAVSVPGLTPAATLIVPIEAAELVEAVRRFCGTLGG